MVIDVFSLALYSLFFVFLFLIGIRGKGEWKQRGMITGFVIALFTEMWGLPLSLLVISSLAGSGGLPYQFDNLMYFLIQPKNPADAAFVNMPFAFLTEYTIARTVTFFSIFPIIYGWFTLKKNVNSGLVTSGPYSYSRNPQYIGFILFTIGMVLYWPTLLTIPMGIVLCLAYLKLAYTEEERLKLTYEESYKTYAQETPRFLGKRTWKIFKLPNGLSFIEKLVVSALILPFILWFSEALLALLAGEAFVRAYWFSIAYIFPVHIGVVISMIILVPIGIYSFTKWLIIKRKNI